MSPRRAKKLVLVCAMSLLSLTWPGAAAAIQWYAITTPPDVTGPVDGLGGGGILLSRLPDHIAYVTQISGRTEEVLFISRPVFWVREDPDTGSQTINTLVYTHGHDATGQSEATDAGVNIEFLSKSGKRIGFGGASFRNDQYRTPDGCGGQFEVNIPLLGRAEKIAKVRIWGDNGVVPRACPW